MFFNGKCNFPMSPEVQYPHRRRPPGGVQNSIFSIKSQLNFEVTFTCHFAPLSSPTWLQLGPNLSPTWPQLGPTWPPKCLLNWSKIDVTMQLPEKLIFSTPPMRNHHFCISKGVQKSLKTPSKTTWYTCGFPTSKKHPSSIDLGPSWLPLGLDFGPS